MSRFDGAVRLPGGGEVLFTSRAEGNLSSVGGQGAEHGGENRERLRTRLRLDALVRGYQVHGTVVEIASAVPVRELPQEQLAHADGHASALPGLGVMALAADCLPVALGAPGAVAIIHAGWRGLAGGVLEHGAAAISRLAPGEPLKAVIGPAAGVCCYEVGEEVHAVFAGAHRCERNLDLAAIARDRLLACGVGDVEVMPLCTICDERFFSHRREGPRAGRQGGIAWLS